jgi:alpha-mannosidase
VTGARPLRIDGAAGLGALKPLEDGDRLALRLYEPHGRAADVVIEPPPGWAIDAELDLLERPLGRADGDIGPFAVRTWRLVRT